MSNIKVGDKVRFLNDVGGGVVTKVIDSKRVMVLGDDGFEIPSYTKELVAVETDSYNNLKKVEPQKNVSQQNASDSRLTSVDDQPLDMHEYFYPDAVYLPSNKDNLSLFLAFVPSKKAESNGFRVFLINDSNYNTLYSIATIDAEEKVESEAVGMLEANTKVQVSFLNVEDVNVVPTYACHLVFYRQGEFKMKEPVSKSIEVNPVKFFKETSFTTNDFFNQNAMILRIIDEKAAVDSIENMSHKDFKKLVSEKSARDEQPQFKSAKSKQKEIVEVDLHMHELIDDFRGLTNGEMVEIQMKKFRDELNNAMRTGVKKIVFIHGVGAGKLKVEIRKELDRMKKKLEYQDASFKEYGYGATLVRIY